MLSNAKQFLAALVLLVVSSVAVADALDEITARGTLRIGVSEFAPWTIKTESGDLKGFEIDIGRKIADDMNVEPIFKVYVWEDIVPALNKGEIDLIAAGMAITPERALKVEFTLPYFQSGVAIAANRELTRDASSLDELDREGVGVIVVADTLAHDVTRTVFEKAEVRVFQSAEEAEAEMVKGDAHMYVASVPEAQFLALRNPELLDMPLQEPLLRSMAGLAVRKGNQELLNFLNAWVTARSADEWIDSRYGYWFESLDWLESAR